MNFSIRQACHWVVNLRYFDDFILAVILVSSVLLAVEDPVDPDAPRNKVCKSRDILWIPSSSKGENIANESTFSFDRWSGILTMESLGFSL